MSEIPVLTTTEPPRRPSLVPPGFERWVAIVLGALGVIYLASQLPKWASNGLLLETPMLIVVAIVAVLGAVILLARLLASAGLSDRAHALAMPEGSIRALIALMLIVVFAVFVAIFFERLIARPGPTQADFAKQVVVLLGTLLTAVTSFYFGEKAMASMSSGIAPSKPIIYRVLPNRLRRGESNSVFITGAGLGAATSASLRRKELTITTLEIRGVPDGLDAFFRIPGNVETGTWTLIVEFAGGLTASLDQAVEII